MAANPNKIRAIPIKLEELLLNSPITFPVIFGVRQIIPPINPKIPIERNIFFSNSFTLFTILKLLFHNLKIYLVNGLAQDRTGALSILRRLSIFLRITSRQGHGLPLAYEALKRNY